MTVNWQGEHRNVLYGTGGGAIVYPVSRVTLGLSTRILQALGYSSDRIVLSTNFDWLYGIISRIQSVLIRGACKAFLIFTVVVLGPFLEEWVFRGALYRFQESQMDQVTRILTNSVLFGAVHLNYALGVASIPYFLVATISGVVYACLREWTHSWHAPAIAHGISNACVIAFETLR